MREGNYLPVYAGRETIDCVSKDRTCLCTQKGNCSTCRDSVVPRQCCAESVVPRECCAETVLCRDSVVPRQCCAETVLLTERYLTWTPLPLLLGLVALLSQCFPASGEWQEGS